MEIALKMPRVPAEPGFDPLGVASPALHRERNAEQMFVANKLKGLGLTFLSSSFSRVYVLAFLLFFVLVK